MKIEIMNKRKKVTSLDIGFALPSREIYIGDHLTPFQQELLGQAKDKCAEKGGRTAGYSAGYSWGKIRIKTPAEERRCVVSSKEEIDRLIEQIDANSGNQS